MNKVTQKRKQKISLTVKPSEIAIPTLYHQSPSFARSFNPVNNSFTEWMTADTRSPSEDRGRGPCGDVASRLVEELGEKEEAELTLKLRISAMKLAQNLSTRSLAGTPSCSRIAENDQRQWLSASDQSR
jgi:hypothetical protein